MRARENLHPLVPWALSLAAAAVLVPFWPALVLAVWTGLVARRIAAGITRLTHGRRRLAVALTLMLLVAVIVPLGVVVAAVTADAVAFVQTALKSTQVKSVLAQLVSRDNDGFSLRSADLVDLAMSQGETAWSLLRLAAGAATKAALDVVVFFIAVYAVVVDGAPIYAWFEEHLPLSKATLRRFAGAFVETGRGMVIGIGGAAVAQGLVATTAYLVLGVPRAFTLGILTAFAGVVPGVGTALVWVPVAGGLFLTGRTGAGIALVVVGTALIGGVDNVLRPIIARRARLDLPVYAVAVAMLGGLALLGAPGLLFGVLALRLAKEALDIFFGDTPPAAAPDVPASRSS